MSGPTQHVAVSPFPKMDGGQRLHPELPAWPVAGDAGETSLDDDGDNEGDDGRRSSHEGASSLYFLDPASLLPVRCCAPQHVCASFHSAAFTCSRSCSAPGRGAGPWTSALHLGARRW